MQPAHTNERNATARDLSFGRFILLAGVALFGTVGVVWFYIIAFPMAYSGRDYPLSLAKSDLIAQCRPNEVAIFGDSRVVAGVLPTAMQVPVENLAFPAASPVETYFFVKRLLRCPQPPRLVIIAHSASMYPQDKYFWSVFAGMGLLSTADMRTVEANARALDDDELQHAERPTAIPFSLLPQLYAMRFPPLYFGNLLGGYVAARWRYNERAMHDAITSSGRSSFGTADGSDAVSDEAQMADWRVSPLVNLYLDRTLALLAARHVPVMIMTMPINAATCAHLPPVVQPRLTAYLAQVKQAYPNVEFVDSTIPCWPNRFYGDAWHFNMSGAIAYSLKLQQVLDPYLLADAKTPGHQDQTAMAYWKESSVSAPKMMETPDE